MTEQSLMITTNEQPCNNQQQRVTELLRVIHPDVKGGLQSIAEVISQNDNIRWNTLKALIDRWYWYHRPIFNGTTKYLNLEEILGDFLYNNITTKAKIERLPIAEEPNVELRTLLRKFAAYCLKQVDKDALRSMHNLHGRYSDVIRRYEFQTELQRLGSTLQNICVDQEFLLSLEANTLEVTQY